MALSLYAGITPKKAGDELREFVLSLPEDKEICWLGKKIVVGKGFEKNCHCWGIRFTEIGEFGGISKAELEIYFKDEDGKILQKKRSYYI